MVADYFLALGSAASGEVETRRREDRAICVDISIPLDPTAPIENARMTSGRFSLTSIVMVDNQETTTEVNDLWRRVLIDLVYQRDELRRRGRIQ